MTKRHRAGLQAAGIAMVAAICVACSASTHGAGTPRRSSSSPSSSPSSTQSPTKSPSPSRSAATSVTRAELAGALLTTADVGHGFTLGTYRPDGQGGPCDPPGTPSVDQRVPPQVSSGRTFVRSAAQISQSAAVYASSAEAARAFALSVKGTNCRHGQLTNGSRVTITAGRNVTAAINGTGVGASTAWQLSNGSVRAVIVATLSGRLATACVFVAGSRVNTSTLPNPVGLAKAAFDKLLAQ